MRDKNKKFKCSVCNKLFDTESKCNNHENKIHPFISGDDWDEAMGIPPRDKSIEINKLKDQIKKLKNQIRKMKKEKKG